MRLAAASAHFDQAAIGNPFVPADQCGGLAVGLLENRMDEVHRAICWRAARTPAARRNGHARPAKPPPVPPPRPWRGRCRSHAGKPGLRGCRKGSAPPRKARRRPAACKARSGTPHERSSAGKRSVGPLAVSRNSIGQADHATVSGNSVPAATRRRSTRYRPDHPAAFPHPGAARPRGDVGRRKSVGFPLQKGRRSVRPTPGLRFPGGSGNRGSSGSKSAPPVRSMETNASPGCGLARKCAPSIPSGNSPARTAPTILPRQPQASVVVQRGGVDAAQREDERRALQFGEGSVSDGRAAQGGEHGVAGGVHPGAGAHLLKAAPAGEGDGFGVGAGESRCADARKGWGLPRGSAYPRAGRTPPGGAAARPRGPCAPGRGLSGRQQAARELRREPVVRQFGGRALAGQFVKPAHGMHQRRRRHAAQRAVPLDQQGSRARAGPTRPPPPAPRCRRPPRNTSKVSVFMAAVRRADRRAVAPP